MEITLTLREKVDSDYHVDVYVTGGRVHLRGCQASGTYVTANITSRSWPAIKAFIDQQLSEAPHEQ